VAELAYVTSLAVFLGPGRLRLIAPPLALAMLLLIPALAILATLIAALISSRARTFTAAQQLSGIALMPVLGLISTLGFKLTTWGAGALSVTIAALLAADLLLCLLAAKTWRREEVLVSL
jgi:hypothetical protein